jgi:hypothetical protein
MATLAFRAARREVRGFRREFKKYERRRNSDAGDQLLREHAAAMESRDCDEFLRLGIEAFRWLEKARANIRADVLAGRAVYDADLESAITRLYEQWVATCARAEIWAKAQAERGYALDNAAEFRECCDAAQDILETRQFHDCVRAVRLEGPAEEGW